MKVTICGILIDLPHKPYNYTLIIDSIYSSYFVDNLKQNRKKYYTAIYSKPQTIFPIWLFNARLWKCFENWFGYRFSIVTG